MWRTELGERTLVGAERELFFRMASYLWNELEIELEDSDYEASTGIDQFDRLSIGQRFVVLAEITAGLLDRKVRSVPLTQANEATIAAVYWLGSTELVNCELYPDFRHLVRATAIQHHLPDVPSLRACDCEYEEVVFEYLRDLLLWDTDFAMEGSAIDLPAADSKKLHEEMGIAEDYYAALVPDPRDVRPHQRVLEKYLCRKIKSYLPSKRKGSRRGKK